MVTIPIKLFAISDQELLGHYRCTGSDFLTHTQFDEPTMVEKKGDLFFFTWINKNKLFYGKAVRSENVLSAIFWNSTNDLDAGVVTYHILANGDFKGKWAHKNSHQMGDEYCVKLKE